MPRKTVITKYNTRTYQVDALDWNRTPKKEVIEASRKLKTGELEKYKTDLISYYKNTYKLQIKKPD